MVRMRRSLSRAGAGRRLGGARLTELDRPEQARHSRAGKLGRALGAGASGLTSLSNTLKALTMSFVGVVSVKPAMTALKSAKATSFFAPIGSSADFL